MEIKIEIDNALEGKFSDIRLCFKDIGKKERKVSLNINFVNLFRFSEDTKSLSFDFFLISSIVYGIDNLLLRHEYSVNGWTREIKVRFPVYNIQKWNSSLNVLTYILNFLTGDYWEISFEKIGIQTIYIDKKNKNINKDDACYQYITLFSGGLDSLVGAINFIESLDKNKKVLLVSHFDSNSAGPSKDQKTLSSYLEDKNKNKTKWIQAKIYLSHYDVNNKLINIETSYRSRSLLFIAIGVYIQTSRNNSNYLFIPENGTISLNYPLTPSRSSSLSTRTTHPYFLLKLQELFKDIGINTELENPFKLLTKGEIISNSKNLTMLKGIYEESVSCSKSGRKMYWNRKKGTRHCGVCIPCIHRRSGLHREGLDTQLYGIDILRKTNPEEYGDIFALSIYIKTPLNKEQIKRNIIINSSSSISRLDDYAELILRSREEIRRWIKNKGNKKIKDLFKIE